MRVLGIKPRSSKRAGSTLDDRVISLAPRSVLPLSYTMAESSSEADDHIILRPWYLWNKILRYAQGTKGCLHFNTLPGCLGHVQRPQATPLGSITRRQNTTHMDLLFLGNVLGLPAVEPDYRVGTCLCVHRLGRGLHTPNTKFCTVSTVRPMAQKIVQPLKCF